MAKNPPDDVIQRLYDSYDQFLERAITLRRFKHDDILPLIHRLGEHPSVDLTHEGFSTEQREIYRLKTGSGETTVLLWSQMHGDEPTATMALFDLFRFFTAEGDSLVDIRTEILENLTIHAIPMLNPDGAERYQRETAFGIDMNRDALKLQAPESRILKGVRDELEADFGFNLHDQSIFYSAGETPKSAVISFLAPPYNEERSVNPVRKRSMQLIGQLNKMLQKLIPGYVGAYSDEFEPRAFGDNMQKWGTSTILVESGGLKGDPEKQFIRKLNYLLLLESFRSIARSEYKAYSVDQYEMIPPNRLRFHSTIFRNVIIPFKGHEFELDLAVTRSEVNCNGATDYYEHGIVSELGDLSTFYGFEEFVGRGLHVGPGQTCPGTFVTVHDLEGVNVLELMRKGYTAVRMEEPPEGRHTAFPMNILGPDAQQPAGPIPERDANLVFRRGDDVVYVVINGFVVDVSQPMPDIGNALIYH